MNIQQKIDNRTEKLAAILAGANARITAKSGTAASNLNGLPDAIATIPQGGGGVGYITVPSVDDLPTNAPEGTIAVIAG